MLARRVPTIPYPLSPTPDSRFFGIIQTMRKWSIAVILFLGIALVSVAWWFAGRGRCVGPPPGHEAIDSTILPAPKWDPERPAAMPPYRWPDDFKLRLHIVIDAPAVPEEIHGASPPIEEM